MGTFVLMNKFTITTKLGRKVVESNITQYAKVVLMSIT